MKENFVIKKKISGDQSLCNFFSSLNKKGSLPRLDAQFACIKSLV